METARQTPPGARPNRNDVGAQASGPSGPVVRVGCLMRRVTSVPEEWPSRLRFAPRAIQNPAYRPADNVKGARRKNPPGPRQFSSFIVSLATVLLVARGRVVFYVYARKRGNDDHVRTNQTCAFGAIRTNQSCAVGAVRGGRATQDFLAEGPALVHDRVRRDHRDRRADSAL